MCRFLETIRVEHGQAQHLAFHQARVDRTAAAHGYPSLPLEQVLRGLAAGGGLAAGAGRSKLRVLYELGAGGGRVLGQELAPYRVRPVSGLVCYEAGDCAYTYKYADRGALEQLREQAIAAASTSGVAGPSPEVLLLRNGYLSDCSYANIVLYSADGRYVTPARPLLAGTARARLLEAGKVTPAKIHLRDLNGYTMLWLINAMVDLGECGVPIAFVTHGTSSM